MRATRWYPIRLTVTVVVAGLAVTLLVWPQLFGAQRALILSQVVAFRAPTAIALCVGAVLFASIACGKRSWGVAAGLAVVLGAGSIASGGILLGRGAADGQPVRGEVTVVVWNTQGGAARPADVARLVHDVDADIVSLPEMDERAAAEVARILATDGHGMAAHTSHGETGYSEIPTSVLIADGMGVYEVDRAAGSTPGLPSVVLRPVGGDGPTVVAAHPFPPLPWRMDAWRAGLEWVANQCDSPDVIVAGDLNATADHLWGLGDGDGLIGSCADASLNAGTAAVGTWPVSAPPWLASPIDHVLAGKAWSVRGASAVTSFDDAGSDHRPIVAELDRR
ncbi:endonuclease/exonuclease/phosphatase family protein [Microbacterium sp. SA39]|uniref:endonuclease/exonuclease/phosphatase family protein n=1 Tax=Microbacterium sp. SA39 TaxID=1263625 RepID=UPI00061E3402|nr:endonuclease/exonuclease/phosphatase family protein [Microbacterium sp. SA39]KJQ56100.1 Endonuclease/Exonuclease/phosphatase family protein [Microbacterium sp. SA39]